MPAKDEKEDPKPVVRPSSGSSVYDKPRAPPIIRRPVPIAERDKYDYKPMSSKVKTSVTVDDEEYYDEYEDEVPLSTTTTTTQKPTRKPEVEQPERRYKPKRPNLRTAEQRMTTKKPQEEVEEPRRPFKKDEVIPKRQADDLRRPQKRPQEEPEYDRRTQKRPYDSEEVEEVKRPIKRPYDELEEVRRPIKRPFEDTEPRRPLKRPESTKRPEEYDDRRTKVEEEVRRPPKRTEDYEERRPIKRPVDDYEERRPFKNSPPKRTENRNTPRKVVEVSVEEDYEDYGSSSKEDIPPRPTKTIPKPEVVKEREPIVRVVKRPFLPSRGGNPYSSRGLQPIGTKAEVEKDQSDSSETRQMAFLAKSSSEEAYDDMTVAKNPQKEDPAIEDIFKPVTMRPKTDFRLAFRGDTHYRVATEIKASTPKSNEMYKNPLDINENEYDVTLNDALNPTIPNLPVRSEPTGFGTGKRNIYIYSQNYNYRRFKNTYI